MTWKSVVVMVVVVMGCVCGRGDVRKPPYSGAGADLDVLLGARYPRR